MVPANDQLTRTDLDTAVRNIAGSENVWIDGLCISQDDSDPGKAREIRKQSEIFRLAPMHRSGFALEANKLSQKSALWFPNRRT
jgi:hypothetical protein